MKEPYSEELAIRTGLESCAVGREAIREALTEEDAGRAIEPRKTLNPECRRCMGIRKATSILALSQGKMGLCVVVEPWHVSKLHTRETGDPAFDLMRWYKVRMENPMGAHP